VISRDTENEGKMAPILNASFDIECYSSHGDMPLAKKGCNREAKLLVEMQSAVDEDTLASWLTAAALNRKDDAGIFGNIYLKTPSKEDYTFPKSKAKKIVDKLKLKDYKNSKQTKL